jgi:WD40 repeat protein
MRSSDGAFIKTITGHTSTVRTFVVLQNGDFASGSWDKTIKIWSADGVLKTTLIGHNNTVYSLKELPNGDLVSCSSDSTILVWNRDNYSIQANISNFEGYFTSAENWGCCGRVYQRQFWRTCWKTHRRPESINSI